MRYFGAVLFFIGSMLFCNGYYKLLHPATKRYKYNYRSNPGMSGYVSVWVKQVFIYKNSDVVLRKEYLNRNWH